MAKLSLLEDEKKLSPTTIEPVSDKVWTFDRPESLYEAPKTTGDMEMVAEDIFKRGEVFAPDITKAAKEDYASRGADPFTTSTEYYKALDEDRKFFAEEFLPEKSAISKAATELAGEAYTPSFGDILPLLAVALFSDDDAFNEGFYKSYNAKKENTFKSQQQKRMAELQDRAQALETKSAFLAKNANFYATTLAVDKASLAVLDSKIKEEENKWLLSKTPVILNAVTSAVKEQVDSLMQNRIAPVKSEEEILKLITSQMPDKGAGLTELHKQKLLEVFNGKYYEQMSSAGIMGSFAKGKLNPEAKDTSTPIQGPLLDTLKMDSAVNSGLTSVYKGLVKEDLSQEDINISRRLTDIDAGIKNMINKYNLKDFDNNPLTISKLLTMSDEEIENIDGLIDKEEPIDAYEAYTQFGFEIPNKAQDMIKLKNEYNKVILNIIPNVKPIVDQGVMRIKEAEEPISKFFNKVSTIKEDKDTGIEFYNKQYNVDLTKVAKTLSMYMSAESNKTLNDTTGNVAYLALPDFWKTFEIDKARIKETKGEAVNAEEIIGNDQVIQAVKKFSNDSKATDEEKKKALEYLSKASYGFENRITGHYGGKDTVATDFLKRNIYATTKSDKGVFMGIPIQTLKRSHDILYTLSESNKNNFENFQGLLQTKYGMDSETSKAVGKVILKKLYEGQDNYINIFTTLMPLY